MSHEWSHNENKNIGKSKSILYYISKGKISKSTFIYISIWGCKYNKDYKAARTIETSHKRLILIITILIKNRSSRMLNSGWWCWNLFLPLLKSTLLTAQNTSYWNNCQSPRETPCWIVWWENERHCSFITLETLSRTA